jgi:GntR family transcriptional regulator
LQGHQARFVVRQARRLKGVAAPRELEVEKGAGVFLIERLLVNETAPLALLTCYIPEDLCPGLLSHDLNCSVFELIERHYGHRFATGTQWVTARYASPGEARLLGIPALSPVVVVRRVSRMGEGRPVEYFECLLRPDRYELVMELSRE